MAEVTLRNVFFGIILFAMCISSVFFLINKVTLDNEIILEAEYTEMSEEFKAVQTSSDSMVEDFETQIKTAPKGTFQTITDFFTRSIKVVTSMFTATTVATQSVTAVSTSWGFKDIPTIIWASLILIVVALITFVIISAWNRNKT